ncbi:TMEM175 family protein [Maribacter luteus]|uniref:TMEM175 family protein n=1 Tax=Maribacter luteus TaxID=2594478 RepID=UPI002493B293|nr:TMEM175 family protein [Maribacter luteus]
MKYLHNINRIEAFSDAVFAFAATLLVVTVGYEESTSVIKIDWLVFLGFGISFFVLVALWWLHYNFFRRTDYLDGWIITINTILLFVVLYYIFPLKSLINSITGLQRLNIDEIASLFQLYSLGFLLIFSCFSLMYLRAYLKTKSIKENVDLLFYARHFGIFTLIAFVSILCAALDFGLKWALPELIYMLLGPLCYLHANIFFKKHQTEP